jgi:hypothetical protein
MVMIWGCWAVGYAGGRSVSSRILERHACLRRRRDDSEQYLALSQAIRQHGVQQPSDVIGQIAATISFGA